MSSVENRLTEIEGGLKSGNKRAISIQILTCDICCTTTDYKTMY